MIVYHPAFDLYHCVYRLLQILSHLEKKQPSIETDRLRLWDYFLLFPDQVHTIKLKRDETEIKKLINNFIHKVDNPYEEVLDNRKMFEKIRPYQLTAIKCLASYNIIDKEKLKENRITVVSKTLLEKYTSLLQPLSRQEQNVISLMTSYFLNLSMFGPNGFKTRTKLMESKYDAE